MTTRIIALLVVAITAVSLESSRGQDDRMAADRAEPGDAMIHKYLAKDAARLQDRLFDGVKTADDWTKLRPRFKDEYLYMLGLDPMPARTPLKATVTGTVEGDGYVVENLHYQSVPGLYVTANLYRPATIEKGARLPAVLYVCGHTPMGRDGNKAAFQSFGIWFARHGYVCLVVDTLQLGEIAGIHHGTYRENRWWWHARGYTPAGVECWNGIRGIDTLVGRSDVDPDRIAVTGISGGGAVTFWIAAADDRVKVAVPVSGMADLVSYVGDRVVNGHCDCMFMYNTFQWPWARIAALIAPRPMLFVNSDHDSLFPIDADERIINTLERFYSLFGAGDRVDALVSMGGHDYRKDIRQASYRFLGIHLKHDARPVDDSEVDLVVGSGKDAKYPIAPARLRVFATDADLPADQKNTSIDREFVPMAKVELPVDGGFPEWKAKLLAELRRVTFRALPERVAAAGTLESNRDTMTRLETEDGIVTAILDSSSFGSGFLGDSVPPPKRIVLVVPRSQPGRMSPLLKVRQEGDRLVALFTRGSSRIRWTQKNPPNYVERSHVLLGRTVDGGRVQDVIAAARYLKAKYKVPVALVGPGPAGVTVAYAALLEPDIDEVYVISPPSSHMEPTAPQLLNVLRVLDIPEALGLLAPKPLTLIDADDALAKRVIAIYASAGAADQLHRP